MKRWFALGCSVVSILICICGTLSIMAPWGVVRGKPSRFSRQPDRFTSESISGLLQWEAWVVALLFLALALFLMATFRLSGPTRWRGWISFGGGCGIVLLLFIIWMVNLSEFRVFQQSESSFWAGNPDAVVLNPIGLAIAAACAVGLAVTSLLEIRYSVRRAQQSTESHEPENARTDFSVEH